MRTPEELRKRLEARWKNQRCNWLLRQGEWPLPFSTEPPTEAGAVVVELGQASRWSQAKRRFDELATWASSESWHMELSRHFGVLADFSEAEFERLSKVVMWLREYPCSNLYPRQLPIPGIDSKWVESRRAVVACCRGVLARGVARHSRYRRFLRHHWLARRA